MFKFYSILVCFVTIFGFTQCKSADSITIAKELQIESNIKDKVYYQEWVSGVPGGGSGINLYIHESVMTIVPLEVYFKYLKSSFSNNESFYVASFKTPSNSIKDYVMDSNTKHEYGNESLNLHVDFPFNLKEGEAIITYMDKSEKKYLKLTNILKKPMLAYPSAPNNTSKFKN